ncbi:MAG: ABC transporter ATP-binding protein, partial [Candidatus Bathyarchaeota archaeon]
EPSLGLAPIIVAKVFDTLCQINDEGVAILLVEHVMRVIMGLCDRVAVLDHGEKICEGSPRDVCSDENVIKVYLGKKFCFDEEY